MPKLLRSSETTGCGATIELDNGDVVYVSIAQSGVLVRKRDMNGGLIKSLLSNFFGPKLYNESSVYKNAQTARALSLIYSEQASPLSFKNPVLAAFSNAIWHCSSAAEVCTVLNEAVAKFPDAERAVGAVPASKDFKNSDEKIVSDLADLMAAGDLKPDAFYDVSVLPHPKEDILLAIEREISREPLDARAEWLAVGAAFLPSFQQGIGPKPLFWVGADLSELERSIPDVREQIRALAHSPDRARAERYLALMEIESDQIQTRIDAAMRLRRARVARPTQSATPSSLTPPRSVQTSLAPVTSRSRAAAPPSGSQHVSGSGGDALRIPGDVLEWTDALLRLLKSGAPFELVDQEGARWVNELLSDAAHPLAPPELKAYALAVRRYVGTVDGLPLTRAQTRTFTARFEIYLITNTAPNAQLASVFGLLRSWLATLCVDIKEISDDIRDWYTRVVSVDRGAPVLVPDRPRAGEKPERQARIASR